MDAAQKLIFLLFSLFPTFACAAWSAVAHHAGYFGDLAAGVLYEPSEKHAYDLSIGSYPADGNRAHQLNLAYRYNRWRIQNDNFIWRPLQVGIFAVTTLEERHYFYRSPSKFPEENYYDQTALRLGIELGTQVDFQDLKISGAYYMRFLDQSLIALYNNEYRKLSYFMSSGIALIYHFD